MTEEIRKLHKSGVTIIFVSHSPEDIVKLANRVLVLTHGKILFDGEPQELFSRPELLDRSGLLPPPITQIMFRLKKFGFDVDTKIFTIDDAEKEILKKIRRRDK